MVELIELAFSKKATPINIVNDTLSADLKRKILSWTRIQTWTITLRANGLPVLKPFQLG